MADFDLGNGYVLKNVHDPFLCQGRGCSIHHPSDHHMRDWPMVWRDFHMYFERQCSHGIGHPDPDDMAYQRALNGRDDLIGVHGCDGCCFRP
jgi:hypothetical protein